MLLNTLSETEYDESYYPDKVSIAAQCPINGSGMSGPPVIFEILFSFASMNSVVFNTLDEPAPPNNQTLPSGNKTEAAYALGLSKPISDFVQLLVRYRS
jgi:hypothetical protein